MYVIRGLIEATLIMNIFYRVAIVLGIFILCLETLPRSLACANSNTPSKSIKVADYILACGKYRGYELEYEPVAQKPCQKEIVAILHNDEITIKGISTKFKVKGNKLYVGNRAMYEITGDNKFTMSVGGGIVFEHE